MAIARPTVGYATSGDMGQLFLMFLDIDGRSVLPAIHCPTLVMHRRGDRVVNVRNGRYLAEHIPGAKYVEFPGIDHSLMGGDTGQIIDELEEIITGVRGGLGDRFLAFTPSPFNWPSSAAAIDTHVLRRCGACGELKSLVEFAWRRIKKGQRDNYCRACRAAYKQDHYAANRQRYIDNAAHRRRRLTEENITRLIEYFRDHPCVDCGQSDPLVLEFDHVGDKAFSIGSATRERRWTTIEVEISECEVVCANCHRRRTARRGRFMRAAVLDGPARPRDTRGGH